MENVKRIIFHSNNELYLKVCSYLSDYQWPLLLEELINIGKKESHTSILHLINEGNPEALHCHLDHLKSFATAYPFLVSLMKMVSPPETITPVLIASFLYLDDLNPFYLNEISLSFILNEKIAEKLYSIYGSLIPITKEKFYEWVRSEKIGLIYWSLQEKSEWEEEGLLLAAQEGKEKVASILLPSASKNGKKKVLEIATEYKNVNIIRLLLLNWKVTPTSSTFTTLCSLGTSDIVLFLIEKKKLVPSSEDLYLAASKGHILVVRLLLPFIKRIDKRIMKDVIRYGYTEVLRILINSGIKLYSELITIAAENGHTEILRLLLSYIAPTNSEPILQAVRRNYIDCVRILLPYGYEKECKEEAIMVSNKTILLILDREM